MLFKRNGVIELSRKWLEPASQVMALAFEREPLINYVLATNTPEQRRAFFIHMCEIRYDMGWPILGYVQDSRLVGVALTSVPGAQEWPASLVRSYMQLGDIIGLDALKRLEAYTQLSNRHRPKEPHVYFGAIGLDPQHRGKGYGGALVEAVQDVSRQHPTSTGVALDTETPARVPYCEGFGYRVIAQDKLGPNDVWVLFRPND